MAVRRFITDGVTDTGWDAFVSKFDGTDIDGYAQMYQTALDSMDID